MVCARRVPGAAKAAAQRAGVAAEGEILEGAPARRVLEFAHHVSLQPLAEVAQSSAGCG
jgi:hypothetical protein